MQINSTNFSSYNYQLQFAEKLIMSAREKQNQAEEMYGQAEKLQGQAQTEERNGNNIKMTANSKQVNAKMQQQIGVSLEINQLSFKQKTNQLSELGTADKTNVQEAMNEIKSMFLEQPKITMNAQNNIAPKTVIHLLRM